MARILLFIPVLVLTLVFISFEAQSNVLIEDTRDNSVGVSNQPNVSSGTIETGNGEQGNYVIIACANDNEIGLNFGSPVPPSWTELDDGSCIGLESSFCAHSIWGSFVDDADSQTITCTWNPATVLFVAGSIRYTDVDPIDPIIDVQCRSGFGTTATFPSINTEAGSQVLAVLTAGASTRNMLDTTITSRAEPSGGFIAAAVSNEFFKVLSMLGRSQLFPIGGPTGDVDFNITQPAGWRACTIGIRMAPVERNVPTMSEWGLISFAAFAGIAGVWYLRRRQAIAS